MTGRRKGVSSLTPLEIQIMQVLWSEGPGNVMHVQKNLPAGTAQNQICGTAVRGDLQFQNNGTAVLIGATDPPSAPPACPGNAVGGDLQVQNDTAAVSIVGNTVGGILQVQNDSGTTVVTGNTVTGILQDQNNTAPTQVFNNSVGSILQCQNDTSITGGGNTARLKQGQCATF